MNLRSYSFDQVTKNHIMLLNITDRNDRVPIGIYFEVTY